jgi:hypothetical protein
LWYKYCTSHPSLGSLMPKRAEIGEANEHKLDKDM